MPKIIHEYEKCIGCGSCVALCPKFFEMGEEGKAHLKGAKIDPATRDEELEITDIDCAKDAVDSCPVEIIHIKKS